MLMTVAVGGLFSAGIVGVVHIIEERLISRDLGGELERILRDDLAQGRNPVLDPGMRFFISDGQGSYAMPPALDQLDVGFHEVFEGDLSFHALVRDIDGRRFVLLQDQSDFEAREQVLYASVLTGYVLSIALAGLLADAGKRVVVVDLDPHGSMTSYFGYDPDTLEHSAFDLFLHQGNVPEGLPASLLRSTSNERISLLPSSTALATLERQSPGKSGLGLVVSKSLAQLWQDFDHAIIDSPPLLGVLMVNALAASQHLVIPVQTEFLAVKGLERMVNTLAMINRSRKQALPYTIVPTLFDRRTQASLSTLRILNENYPDNLWQAFIPIDTRLRDASRAGVTPSQHDGKSRGGIAYRALLKHLLAQQPATRVA